MSIAFDNRPGRLSPAEIEPVALDLIRRRGAEVLSTARRYAASPEDAEDAYQRALEVLLTKAPSTDDDVLVPWLKTVVKHEAYQLRRRAERDVPSEPEALDAFAAGARDAADERAERYDRLRLGVEALARLKPQETRCLLLKAEGLSYQEICAATGFSYTKVNRCLTEGRRAFFARVEGIESGAECERLAPLLSALSDGEASAEDMATLRPHLRGCSACRATLRDFRAAPREVAGLAAPVAAGGGALAWLGDRIASTYGWLRSSFEAAAAHKAAVVAASTVAVAGGGAATMQADWPQERPAKRATAAAPKRPPAAAAPATPTAASLRSGGSLAATKRPKRPKRSSAGSTTTQPQSQAPSAATPTPTPQTPATPASSAPRAQPPDPDPGEFGP